MELKILLAVLCCLVCIHAQKSDCPEPNILQSNRDEDKKYLNLEVISKETNEAVIDDAGSLIDPGNVGGEIVTSNDIVVISANFQDNTLLSIEKVSAEFKVATEATLTLLQGDTVLLKDEKEVPQGANWVTVDFNIPQPVLGVDAIEIGFFSPTGELKIRNIVLVACVETGWCPWKGWGICSKSCGEGKQSRSRVCECPNPDPDRFICATGSDMDTRKCDEGCCPQPPSWGKWSEWPNCPYTCGPETTVKRTRKCIPDECPNDEKCKGKSKQTRVCEEVCCPEPPTWGKWSEWPNCPYTCGPETKVRRTRKCIPDECPNGEDCEGKKVQTRVCEEVCCPEPPKWSKWTEWPDCPYTCGPETTVKRTRKCIPDECPNDEECDGKRVETRVCKEVCCPQPPKWGKWTQWSDCGKTCGSASRFRTRKCIEDECPDGTKCKGPSRQTELCDLPCCEVIIEAGATGVSIRHVGPSTDVKPNLVWRGTNKFIFLRENSMGTDRLIVTFTEPQIIFEAGIETLLASYAEMNFMDAGVTWRSPVPEPFIEGFVYDKHKKTWRPDGIQPVSKVNINFGYPTGEIRVRNLYFIVCPTEEAGCGPGGKGSCVDCGSCKKNAVCKSGGAECSAADCCCFPKRLSRKEKRQCR